MKFGIQSHSRALTQTGSMRLLERTMTVNGTYPILSDASRRSGGLAPIAYYYGYYSARAETV